MMSEDIEVLSETDPLVEDENPFSPGGSNRLRPNYGAGSNSYVNADYRTFLNLLRENVSSEHQHPLDNPVTVALQRCNDRVLKPYRRLLLLVGWAPWFEDPVKCWQKAVNFICPLFVMLFVLNGYIIQYAACFRRDSAGGAEPWLPSDNVTNMTASCEEVIISQYIIPDILHSLAYLYSFYLLRFAQSEQLPTLMERVFLQTSPTQSGFLSQGRLIRVMGILLLLCVAWVLLSLVAQVIHVIAMYQNITFSFFHTSASPVLRILLLILMLLSFVFLDIVYTAVVINYCVQCSLLTFYIEGLQAKLRQKLIDFSKAYKEIAEIESHLRSLNYTTGLALSIVIFNFGTMSFLGAVELFRHPNKIYHYDKLMYVSTALSILFWISIMALPIIQAARLSAACNSLRKVGHMLRVKPFVYQDVPDQELDAFLLYTSSLTMRAKIFTIPVKTSYLVGGVVLFSFILLLLFQTQALSIWLQPTDL